MTTQETPAAATQTIAAVDLGSNSFHMIVAQIDNDQLQVIDRLKEMVRLGAGLDADKQITPEVQERALSCLSRFGQRLRELPRGSVRAVGTNTMRQIRDRGEFLRRAQQALGHPIEIIAGREEARLVYLGVAHGLAAGDDKRLVVDIGGGSTELIIGQGYQPLERESLFMGCVSMSQRYFADGNITKEAMEAAVIAGRLEIRPVRRLYSEGNWEQAVGSSGTIRSIRDVVQAAGWSTTGITRGSLKKLRKTLIAAGHVDNIRLEGLSDDRRPVFVGGVAVLSAVFKALDIEVMRVSELALREGLLYELLGIFHHQDVREQTVDTLVKRFGLDAEQGRLVASTAASLLQQAAEPWTLTNPDHALMIDWVARLHEIGLIISHGSFHKHGAYILANADLPGFSRQQQSILAALLRGLRRKFPAAVFNELAPDVRECAQRLCMLLRLSALLHRGRSHSQKPNIEIQVQEREIQLRFPINWLKLHPLTRAELETETGYLQAIGYRLSYQ